MKYESAGQEHFQKLFPVWIANQWIHFADESGPRWCQPDGYTDLGDRVLLVEFKYQHTLEAWEQLRFVYAPLLEHIIQKPVSVLEVVKWYDPLVVLPERVELISDPRNHSSQGFGVHIWRN